MNNPFTKFGIEHLSPSQLNTFSESPAMWVMEKLLGHKRGVAAPMIGGKAVEAGVVAGLLYPKMEPDECVKVAQDTFTSELRGAKFSAANDNDPRAGKWGDAIPGMVRQGLTHLRPHGVPTHTQGLIKHQPEGLSVPIIGYFDLQYDDIGVIVDLKATLRMPPTDDADNVTAKLTHARQVSFYKHSVNDNYGAWLAYLTDKRGALCAVPDTRLHRDALVQIALILQRFLSLSNDKRELAGLVCPDYEHFMFNDTRARQAALGIWGF